MKKVFLFLFIISLSLSAISQKVSLDRVEPPNWWVGFQEPTLELLVHGQNISVCNVEINSDAVEILKINKAESPNYLFIDLKIKAKEATSFTINFKKKNRLVAKYEYMLAQKKYKPQGYSPADLIYLIMPDRFANGNPDNDVINGYVDKTDRNTVNARHGGDIEGITQHIDYFKTIGVTALWLNPVIENNAPFTYHGYAFTDFYKVDPRLGGDEAYLSFTKAAHDNNLKVIQDVVYNHCDTNHWWFHDLPFKNWISDNIHGQNYRGSLIVDPHASVYDLNNFQTGWFVTSMADLNQRNKFLANYLIQNTIWWIEAYKIDGLRIDTYSYCDQEFMSELNARLLKEYPTLSVVGEIWLQRLAAIASFQGNSPLPVKYNTHLQSVTDFAFNYAVHDALNQSEGWAEGMAKIYYALSQDFLYYNPYNNVIFIDNHDEERIFSTLGEDINKMKMAIAILMTMRGIPVVYYGTEIAMTSDGKDDGDKRKDFPGGWKGDEVNVFTQNNLNATQAEIFKYFKKIANWRLTSDAVHKGKYLHFVPQNGIYTYFRYTKDDAVMVMLNNSDKTQTVDCKSFAEILKNYSYGINIITEKKIALNKINIDAKSAKIIQLYK